MQAAVIVYPASNCDRDAKVALEATTGKTPHMVWHAETALPDADIIVLPGGFSYGDYLRSGAMAARSPIMAEVAKRAEAGTPVIGICNGFQILTEAQLLPGALLRNASTNFICGMRTLRVENTESPFTKGYGRGSYVRFPVAHHDGNYTATPEVLSQLKDQDRIAFTYTDNPNGSAQDIAGILSENRRVLGMMPHPERAAEIGHGGTDGARLFAHLAESLVQA